MTDFNKIQQRLGEHYIEASNILRAKGLIAGEHYTFDGIFLQGSQNYGTDHEGSDIDSKMAITPTYRALLENKTLKHELVLENKEHVVVQPTFALIEQFFKGNVNSLEILYTDHCCYDTDSYWDVLRYMRDILVESCMMNIANATMGMINQKKASLLKCTETTKPFFDEHGYDNKNLIHMRRLGDMLHGLTLGKKFKDLLYCANDPDFVSFMDGVRNGMFSLEEAEELSVIYFDLAEVSFKEMKEKYAGENDSVLKDIVKQGYIDWTVKNEKSRY